MAAFASWMKDVAVDWASDGPWLAMLLVLVGGVALPVTAYSLLDRWVLRRLRVDSVALATRYGGFMNSWAVFGRHASEYRDLRPLFPEAQAAELARFDDGTATIVARFRSPIAARRMAELRFASFAAAGVEYADAGISFQAAGDKPGATGRGRYARGQWLVIGDTLFAFYAPDSFALVKRRQATPALRVQRFPGPLRLLHSRIGHAIVASLWVAVHIFAVSVILERTAMRPGAATAPMDEAALRQRLALFDKPGRELRARLLADADNLIVAARPDDLRRGDLDRLAGRPWLTGVALDLDPERKIVSALVLVGQAGGSPEKDDAPSMPGRWRNNPMLRAPDDPLIAAVREAILASGWTWQPRLWPRADWWPKQLWPETWSWSDR